MAVPRDWTERFYSECGREISLAVTSLNYTHTWSLTLGAAVLAASVANALSLGEGGLQVVYPTPAHWLVAIVGWVIMSRFFVRSCLHYVNVRRWNILARAASLALFVDQRTDAYRAAEQNLVRLADAYYFRWRSPVTVWSVLWDNLKLLYLWFFVLILAAVFAGMWLLWPQRTLVVAGMVVFLGSLLVEAVLFASGEQFRFEAVTTEELPALPLIWDAMNALPIAQPDAVVHGAANTSGSTSVPSS